MQHPKINTLKCIGCGKCVQVCIKSNLEIHEKKARETGRGCIGCGHCEASCPRNAIRLVSDGSDSPIDGIKSTELFNGQLVSDAEFGKLFRAMDHAKGRCQIRVLQGAKLNLYMKDCWEVAREKGQRLFEGHDESMDDVQKRSKVLWDGQQVLFLFADSDERAAIATERMMAEGFGMGIRGFPSPAIMTAYKLDPERFDKHFIPKPEKPLRAAFVIGHGRRVVEPILKDPMKKAKGILGRLFRTRMQRG